MQAVGVVASRSALVCFHVCISLSALPVFPFCRIFLRYPLLLSFSAPSKARGGRFWSNEIPEIAFKGPAISTVFCALPNSCKEISKSIIV